NKNIHELKAACILHSGRRHRASRVRAGAGMRRDVVFGCGCLRALYCNSLPCAEGVRFPGAAVACLLCACVERVRSVCVAVCGWLERKAHGQGPQTHNSPK
ncbi:MAG: hypothetical protein ACPIOQ_67505, partial [Promethearchaeia archaeon]